MQISRTSHWTTLLHTLNYVFLTFGQGIKLKGQAQLFLLAYSDLDSSSCVDTRKSIIGYIMMLGNSLIGWKSKNNKLCLGLFLG